MAREVYASLFQGVPRWTLTEKQCENFAESLRGIIGEPVLLNFCAGNRKFSEIVTLDILNFIKSAKNAVLESENPYSAEYELLAEILKTPAGTAADGHAENDELFQGVISYLAELYPEDFDGEFWEGVSRQKPVVGCRLSVVETSGEIMELKENSAVNQRYTTKTRRTTADERPPKKKGAFKPDSRSTFLNEAHAASRYLLKKWGRLLDEKNSEWERSVIAERAFDFTKQLKKQIENIETVSRTLKPEDEELGRLWTAAKGNWQRSSYDVLEEYSALFLRDLALRELVRSLGKARKNLPSEYEYTTSADYEEVHFKNAGGKTELSGVCESADLSAVLPSEIALLTDTDTDVLFYKRYREGRLQSYEYTEDVVLKVPCAKSRSVKKRKRETEGAFILCVDTSGSMRGINEKLAKSIVFAVLKFALKAKRSCYLISFSTEIETLELSNLSESLSRLLEFLSMSFNGGSSAFLALSETLKMLSTNAYKKADVVFISDFVLPKLDDEISLCMQDAQKRDTLFHGILLGDLKDDGINQDMLGRFNSVAVYNPLDF